MILAGQKGEVHMTLQITRKETGKTETVEVVGYTNLTPDELQKSLKEEAENGTNT